MALDLDNSINKTAPGMTARLNGQAVAAIHANLTTGEGLNLSDAKRLSDNIGCAFMGVKRVGNFEIDGSTAREWLQLPNPNGRQTSDVVRPSWNGLDVARRYSDVWIVDFGCHMSSTDAALYEAPFEYVSTFVLPERATNNRETYRKFWWRFGESRPGMHKALCGLP